MPDEMDQIRTELSCRSEEVWAPEDEAISKPAELKQIERTAESCPAGRAFLSCRPSKALHNKILPSRPPETRRSLSIGLKTTACT